MALSDLAHQKPPYAILRDLSASTSSMLTSTMTFWKPPAKSYGAKRWEEAGSLNLQD